MLIAIRVVATGPVKDFTLLGRGIVGGRSQSLEDLLADVTGQLLDEIRAQAVGLGAPVVVGVSVRFDEALGKLWVGTAQGTAVTVESTAS